jgi:hypothetical protein
MSGRHIRPAPITVLRSLASHRNHLHHGVFGRKGGT